MTEHYHYQKDVEGIVTLTIDLQAATISAPLAALTQTLGSALERLSSEHSLRGVIVSSSSQPFVMAPNPRELLACGGADIDTFRLLERIKAPFRALEKLSVPVVAAINGSATGPAFELCLACNHRIMVEQSAAKVGLPEVHYGLLPSGGGSVRLTALLGLEAALPLLLDGRLLTARQAVEAGLVDQLAANRDQLLVAAKDWLLEHRQDAARRWDQKGFRYPGGDANADHIRMTAVTAPTRLIAKTRGLLPAPEKILDIAVNSMRMAFDAALRAESRAANRVIASPECRALTATARDGVAAIRSGRYRPAGAPWSAASAAVIGAGMMGRGIAWTHASRQLDTRLSDTRLAAAEAGRAKIRQLADRQHQRGRLDAAQRDDIGARISAVDSEDYSIPVDIVIEAVDENLARKERVIEASFAQLNESGIYASNTSTLPIAVLARACPDPARFVGIHFFSPVEKMPLVEIIAAPTSSDDSVRKAFDYVTQLGKIPIVVNDGRGFFTSRVFGTYLDEGQALLQDGLSAVATERAAWIAGMPVGPLAVHDEVSLVLTNKVVDTHALLDQRLGVDSGFGRYNTATRDIALDMVNRGRGGRHYGGGFYDYPDGAAKSLWPGLSDYILNQRSVSMRDARDRLIYRQVIESLRCLQEGVLRSEVEANVGSVMAIGFPQHTGGVLHYVRTIGIDAFATRAAELADRYGPRFTVSAEQLDCLQQPGELA